LLEFIENEYEKHDSYEKSAIKTIQCISPELSGEP